MNNLTGADWCVLLAVNAVTLFYGMIKAYRVGYANAWRDVESVLDEK